MAKSKMAELWLKKAGRDLRFSKAALTLEEQFYDEIVFHCQQSVEKSIKAFLAFHREPFGKTHDIGELLLTVSKVDADFLGIWILRKFYLNMPSQFVIPMLRGWILSSTAKL